MNTFQTVIFSILHGFGDFLPIQSRTHQLLANLVVNWSEPSSALSTALNAGLFLSLLLYFRHDWASMISSVLQMILFRKRPMTLDERIPLFLIVTSCPILLAGFYLPEPLREIENSTPWICGITIASGLALVFADYWNRMIKSTCDWKWSDALIMGLWQAASLLSGFDSITALLLGAFFLNYKREAALKYSYYALTPILLFKTIAGLREIDFHGASPGVDFSWLSFSVAIVVTCLGGLLAIGALLKHFEQKGVSTYIAYRCSVAIAVGAIYWYRFHM